MDEMNDKQIDTLLKQAFQRQDMAMEIEHNVMKHLKREHRRTTAWQWIKVVAFCFGLPAILFVSVGGLMMISMQLDNQTFQTSIIVAAIIFAASLLFTANKLMIDFS